MGYIVWKDSFNIGKIEMDEQHKLFVGHINELYDAMQSGTQDDAVVPILAKLTDYIQVHFADEESLLRKHNYPMLAVQIKQHEYYVSELLFLKSAFNNKTQTAQNILLFLKDWFLHHITTEDQKYMEYI